MSITFPRSLFFDKTLKLLKERPKHITLSLISEETKLPRCWLDSILYSKNKNELDPGIKRVETLYNYLADKPFSFDTEPVNDIFNKDDIVI